MQIALMRAFWVLLLSSAALANEPTGLDIETIKAMGQRYATGSSPQTATAAYPALILVTTKAAPVDTLWNFIEQGDHASAAAPELKTLQLFVGIDRDFVDVLAEIRMRAQENKETAAMVQRRLDIHFDPEWVSALKVGTVAPLLALAECRGDPYPENCTLLARAEGDLPVKKFLRLATEKQVPWAETLLKPFESEQP